MEMQFEKMLEQLTKFIREEARSETVVGQPFTLGEFNCIPVVRLGLGFGSGGREGDAPKTGHGEGVGMGAGMGIQPIGFLVSRGDEISFIGTKDDKGLAKAFEKVPELLDKFLEHRAKKEELVEA